jgi:tetratricopeptide (TPR) repeat protein
MGAWSGRAAAADEYGDDDARTAARALAAQGAVAFEERDFEHALELFERAGAIIPAPTITLMEARTLVELGRLVEALERYGATEHMLSLDPTNEAYRDAAALAERETQAVLERMPTLRVHVEGAVAGEILDLVIDGKKIQPALAAMDRPSDPGPHRIDVHTSLGRTAARELTLNERAHEDIELALPPLAPPTPPPAQAPAPHHTHSANAGNTAGWVLVISGAAFTGIGTLTGVMALNHQSELNAVCTPGCPPSSANTLDAYRLERNVSYASFVLGGLALAGGTYLVLTHPARKVALYVTPNLVAMGGSFQ